MYVAAVVLAPSQLHPVSCSPWDQSGWRCERGRCRCSRSRWRAPQHRRRTSSPARETVPPTPAAFVGAVAAAAPGTILLFVIIYTANVRSYLMRFVVDRKCSYHEKKESHLLMFSIYELFVHKHNRNV